MKNRMKTGLDLILLMVLLAFMPSSGGSQVQIQNPSLSGAENQILTQRGTVYVCACLKTKSCFCMTEAKTEGPCACGTQGGPPLKAVASDSAWAKANREALSQ